MNNPDSDSSSDMRGDFLPNDYEYNILSCQVQNASEKALQLDLNVRFGVKSKPPQIALSARSSSRHIVLKFENTLKMAGTF